MVDSRVKTFKILLSGRVQGVGYRYFTESRAVKYNIKGYVKNTRDRKVEIVCQGEEEDLERFIDEVKKGPSLAVVTDVKIERLDNSPIYYDFEIRFDY